MKTHDWNPDLYLKFDKERIQPSIDLVSRIDYEQPTKIIDIGCGPGNSTQILVSRWPDANVIGVDNSLAMIQKATNDYPNQKWLLFDAGEDNLNEKFDIVFSNATIQWIPDHDKLINQFADLLNGNGILAVQIPLFYDMPLSKIISEAASRGTWKDATSAAENIFTIKDASFYYDQLSKYFSRIDMWTTDYYHVMESQESILNMIRSTGLKPYLERITDDIEKQKFEKLVFEGIKQSYPSQNNGKVLFPFKRLFFVAKK